MLKRLNKLKNFIFGKSDPIDPEAIQFYSAREYAPYELIPEGHFPAQQACGYLNDEYICVFERMSIQGETLNVSHFALLGNAIGKGHGEKCLRTFAALVKTQAPAIQNIKFELGDSSSESDVQKLAQARKKLFEKIGATGVCVKPQRSGEKLEVSGNWHISKWSQEEIPG